MLKLSWPFGRSDRGDTCAGEPPDGAGEVAAGMRGRRGLFKLGAAAAAAGAGAALLPRSLAEGADGDPLVLGQGNSATNNTVLSAPDANTALLVSGGVGTGIEAATVDGFGLIGSTQTGVAGIHGRGDNDSGRGVFGLSNGDGGIGVWGEARGPSGHGVFGVAADDAHVGVQGEAHRPGGGGVLGFAGEDGVGVQGHSFGLIGTGVRGQGDGLEGTGVEGHAPGDGGTGVRGHGGAFGLVGNGASTGVLGESPTGTGVRGTSETAAGFGVFGHNDEGIGVQGSSDHGIGVRGSAGDGTGVFAGAVDGEALRAEVVPPKGGTEPGDGIALHAVGPVMFSSAGLTSIPASADDITIHSGVQMTPQTKVLATLQGHAGNQRHILNVQTLGADMFRVRFDGPVTGGMQVAWFVIS